MKDTLETILELSHDVLLEDHPENTRLARFANYLMDTLGESVPCGYEQPTTAIYQKGVVVIPDYSEVTTSDGRALAAAILDACDRADNKYAVK